MKALLQTVGLLVAVGAVVGGITFLLQFSVNPLKPTPSTTPPIPPGPVPQVVFPRKLFDSQPGVDGEYEMGAQGHRDFLFYHTEKKPLYLGLEHVNCSCLGKVEFCQLSPEDTRRFLARAAATQVTTALFMIPPIHFWDREAVERLATETKASWETFKLVGGQIAVQPHQLGLVRVHWKGEREGPIRLAAELSNQTTEAAVPRAKVDRLEMMMTFVPAVRIYPLSDDLQDLNPRETKTTEFICWSSTRPEFKLEQKADTQHPCYEIALRPLTAADREAWAQKMASSVKTKLLSGYVATVKVHERRSDKEQLDLGPIRRAIEFTADAPYKAPLAVLVTGNVRGEIKLVDAENRDRLSLGIFKANDTTTKKFLLESEQAATELAPETVVEPTTLNYVQVRLGKKELVAGRAQWTLTLTVPANRASGRFPSDSAVVLKILGSTPRQIRIPISGVATN